MNTPQTCIGTRAFYEIDGVRSNLWRLPRRSHEFVRESLRYWWILRLLPKKKGRVLDLGCGDGYLSSVLADQGWRVTALDLAVSRLAKIKSHHQGPGPLDVSVICADLSALATASEFYDAVVASEVLEHIPVFRDALQEIYRVLVPGGIAVITVPHKEDIEYWTCPHCGASFNRYGHMHSFDLVSIASDLNALGFLASGARTLAHPVSDRIYSHFHVGFAPYRLMDRLLTFLQPSVGSWLAVRAVKRSTEQC